MKKFHISNLKFQIESAICAICVICGLQSAAGLEISHTAVSNVTRISADYSGAVTATNGTGTNPVVTIYWGTSDGGSNATNWANSVALSNVEVGAFGINLADLTPAQYYYINISANEGTDTVWAAASTSWWTLAGAPTSSYPAATGGVFLVVGTNGEFLAPAKSNIISANGLADTNTTAALQGAIATNAGNIVTNAAVILAVSQRVDNAEGAISTNAGNIATNADNFTAHTNNVDNPHSITPAQIGALAGSSNLLDVADTNAARANLGAAAQADLDQIVSQTNQIIVVDGTAFVITNAPASAGDVLVFDPATTTAYFSAAAPAAAGTYPVFRIPVGGAWTDFEIKASTNNFASLCYYYKSWTTNQDATRGDTNALCYFTDDHADDVRVWITKTRTNAISQMLTSTNSEVETVYFYPSHDCTIPWSEWMSSTNTALVWSYVRVDDLGFEMNASGTKQHWSPIRPDSWDAALTEP